MKKLYDVIKVLTAEDGCPWDRIQTLKSMKQYLLEESYELLETMEMGPELHKEELGDLLFQIIFQAVLREKSGDFLFEDVIDNITEKLVSRHPHLFSNGEKQDSPNEQKWELQKHTEKSRKSMMDDIPEQLPALLRADKIQRRAAAVGFDWPDHSGPMKKIEEELGEVKEAIEKGNIDEIEEEFGDLLFAVSNSIRHWNINSEIALINTNHKFQKRFKLMEQLSKDTGIALEKRTLEQQEELWIQAKNAIRVATKPDN
jgi:MazG family protein